MGIQAPRQQQRAGKGLLRRLAQPRQFGQPEAAIERRVVGHHRPAADEPVRFGHHLRSFRRGGNHFVADAGIGLDERRDANAGIHQALVAIHHAVAFEPGLQGAIWLVRGESLEPAQWRTGEPPVSRDKGFGIVGRILHDFRRTAARNLERAGVPRAVAMKLVGHKTESIYSRYAIVARQDLVDGLKRLADYRATLDKTPAAQKVVPITSAML